jgi:hypothetical protein
MATRYLTSRAAVLTKGSPVLSTDKAMKERIGGGDGTLAGLFRSRLRPASKRSPPI